ncbi:hypothetical protein [uncultured Brevundimonas sp.]|uniref:hypothetical protein n=1 Tax=uncultured Brevundimonas sp. TaxID=213418 RepID=UPI0025EF6CFB|nr:hypothetical protein [uncultured Brevundimonas sp.]
MLDTKAIAAALAPIVKSHVAEATAPLIARIAELEKRQPERGEPGEPGRDGENGRDGRDAEPVSDDQIAVAVERYLTANPVSPGKDGKDGAPGERGLDGADGRDGASGVGLAGAVIDRDGILNLTLTNGEVKALGRVEGRDGKDGERGQPGPNLQDFDTDWRPDDKVLILSLDDGETKVSHELFFPYPRDAGVWTEGKAYLKGDGVTWGGSFWIAQDDTTDKPDVGKGWRLAVKRGRDGKDFAGPKAPTKAPVRI